MAGADDDDETPAQTPPHPSNILLLGVLADLTLMTSMQTERLRVLARELRRFREPAPARWRADLAQTLHDHHGPAAILASSLLAQVAPAVPKPQSG